MAAAAQLSEPYVDGLAHGLVRYQVCQDCQTAQRLARYACTHCGSARLVWCDASGRGTIFAVSVVTRAPSEEFRPLAPYGLALVDLAEGARVMGHVAVNAAIGDVVRAETFKVGERTLLRFVPA
jgi:uncharacterized protein